MTPVFIVPTAYARAAVVAVTNGGAIIGLGAKGSIFPRLLITGAERNTLLPTMRRMSPIKRISFLLVGLRRTAGSIEGTIAGCGVRGELMCEEETDEGTETVGGTAANVDNVGFFTKRDFLEGSLDGTCLGCGMAGWFEACLGCEIAGLPGICCGWGKTSVGKRVSGSLDVERGGEGFSTWFACCRAVAKSRTRAKRSCGSLASALRIISSTIRGRSGSFSRNGGGWLDWC